MIIKVILTLMVVLIGAVWSAYLFYLLAWAGWPVLWLVLVVLLLLGVIVGIFYLPDNEEVKPEYKELDKFRRDVATRGYSI